MSNFFSGMIQDLRAKRLWPVALGLLVCLIAIPLLLSKSPKESSSPDSATTAPALGGVDTNLASIQPVVTDSKPFADQTGQSKKVRRFARKNPFDTAAGKSTAPETVGAGIAGTPESGDTTTTGGTDTSIPTTPTDTTTTTPKYYRHVVTVKFGEDGGKKKTRNLTTLKALPDAATSVVVFLGVQSDGKTAVFLLSSSATSAGDGTCVPSDDECTFIYMKKGDAQTIEAVSSDGAVTAYELEIEKVKLTAVSYSTGTTSSNKAKTSGRAPVAKASAVRARQAPKARVAAPKAPVLSASQKAAQRRKAKRQQHRRDLRNARIIAQLGF